MYKYNTAKEFVGIKTNSKSRPQRPENYFSSKKKDAENVNICRYDAEGMISFRCCPTKMPHKNPAYMRWKRENANHRIEMEESEMKKRLLSLLLAVVLITSLVTGTALSAEIVDSGYCGGEGDGTNLTWTLDSDGILTIAGTGEMKDYHYYNEDVPWDSEKIKTILFSTKDSAPIDSSFWENGYGFGGWSYGNFIFDNCQNLTNILVDEENTGYTSIAGVLFSKDKTKLAYCPAGLAGTYSIPSSVESIREGAFQSCKKLTTIVFPESLSEIGGYAISWWGDRYPHGFAGCTRLENVVVSDNNPCYSSDNGVLFNKDMTDLLLYPPKKEGFYIIPNSVKTIDYHAFQDSGLTDVMISDSVETIEDFAFNGCKIRQVEIPTSVTTLRDRAFAGCSLTDIYYRGTEDQWKKIVFHDNIFGTDYGDLQTDATIHYESKEPLYPNGTTPRTTQLYLKSQTPHNICCAPGTPLTMEFSGKVKPSQGMISVWNAESGDLVESISVQNNRVKVDGAKVTVKTDATSYESNTSYYVTIDNGAFYTTKDKKKLLFHGISGTKTWTFATDPTDALLNEFPVKYARKGIINRQNDLSKPPIPNGTKEDCAFQLQKWAEKAGITDFTFNDAMDVLDDKVYLPVPPQNGGDPILVWDKGTDVQQVISDLIFIEILQGYIKEQDAKLGRVVRWNDQGSPKLVTLSQEKKISNTFMSWYDQINCYLKKRNANSNIMVSVAAPLANALNTGVIKATTGNYYTYTKPLIKATLGDFEHKKAIESLQSMSDYQKYKDGTARLDLVKSGGKAVYKVVTEQGGGECSVDFGVELLGDILSDSGNGFAKEVADSLKKILSVKSAVSLSMMLGSTIGMFGLVMDLHDTMNANVEDQVKALYFIGDYYIATKYPDIYNMAYPDDSLFPVEDYFSQGLVASAGEYSDDPILFNWTQVFSQSTLMEKLERGKFLTLRKDLTNYSTLLNYIKSVDVAQTNAALAQYVSAELQQNTSTTTYASCPVRIDVYDKDHTTLLASLSSEDETIQSVPYGSFYLMGENNETKCFVYDPAQYQVEFVPYEDGTMDVMILNGEESGKYFEDVLLKKGDIFTTNELDPAAGLTRTANGENSVIDPTEAVPDRGVNLYGPDSLAVYESDQMYAEVVPFIATDQFVYWSSSDESIISVDDYGTITAQSAGEATITATTASGSKAEKTIVTYVPIDEITLSTEGETISMLIGESFTPEISAYEEADLSRIHWQTGNPLAATVSPTGVVEAQSPGQTVITASVDGLEVSYAVEVHDKPLEITLYQSDTQGDRIKLDLENQSIQNDFKQQVITAVYDEGGRMISLFTETPTIKAGDNQTFYYPIEGLGEKQKFIVKTFVLDKNGNPVQTNGDGVLLGDIPMENAAS